MKKMSILRIGSLVAALGFTTMAYSQRTCGTDAYWAQQLADNPKNAVTRAAMEQSIQQWIQAHPNVQAQGASKKVVYTIPTVVHVVYNTGSQNISDAQIQSQIVVLNDDFRRTNADAGNTPSWFLGVAADCEIEFCLAQQDPSGNPTNGITRTSTSTNSFSTNDNVKANSTGGKDPWPRSDYLNIWVCNLGGGLLGYATFPGGPAADDGVVIGYNYFGTIGTVSAPFNKGRTTTHEVGHWLSLYHSFENGCSGTSSSNCSTNGDRCCDTPPTSSANYGCPSASQNTCTETPTDQNDMTSNYMDYTDDNCMNLFTLDQKARMVATMTGSRVSIQSSQGCVNPTAFTLDAGVTAILSPTGTSCATTVSPQVTIQNFGLNTLTSVTINYDVDGGPNNTFSWSGSLSSSQSQNVTLTAISVVAGSHTFNSSTSGPNGGSDQDVSNDAASGAFTIAGGSGAPLPFTEGFEGVTFPPSGWVLDNPNANATFTRVTTASGFGSSSACAKMDFFSASEDITGQSDYLYTMDLDLSGASSPTVMDFSLAYTRYAAGNEDSLIIWASTNCGATWARVWQNGSTAMQTAPDNTSAFTPSNSEWSAETVNLDAYIGNAAVQIQFQAYSGWGNNLYLDDINIYSSGGGSAPVANFSANASSVCAGSSVSFTDLSTNSPTSWSWSFPGGSPSSSTLQNPSVTFNTAGSYTVTLTATNGSGSDSQTGTITVNANPGAGTSSTIASCGGCDGTATATGTGGASPYTYSWNTSPAQNGSTAVSLCSGSYTVNVIDANGCTGSASATVGSAGSVTSTASGTNASCSGCNGTGTVTASGGSQPYTYLWSNGGNTASISGLCAGSYTVTVTDNNSCTSVSSITVGSGGSITASTVSSGTSCSGSCDGIASANGSNGTSPYTYVWNTSPVQNTGTATGLCAGSYTVTVTDAAGCTATSSVSVSSGPAISVSAIGNNTTCAGTCDGVASANPSGGTAPFTYYWNSSPAQNGATATGLCAGTYGVNLTDANGCSASNSVTIAEPAAIIATATGYDATCGTADGSANVSAFNGTAPYTYLWNNGQTSSMATGLSSGIYSVTVTDANGCTGDASTSVNNAGAPTLFTTSTDVMCNGGSDGSASVTASGGVMPYVYSWSGAISSSASSVSGLPAGQYTVMVTDSAGCVAAEFVTISEPSALSIYMTYLQVSNDTACDGPATAATSGGTSPYTYLWSDPAAQTGATALGLCLGTVNVTVTDNSGCVSVGSIYVDSVFMSVPEMHSGLDIEVFPNPTTGEVNLRFRIADNKHLSLSVYDLAGKLIHNKNLEGIEQEQYLLDLSGNQDGIYFIRVVLDNAYILTRKVSLIK